LAFVGLQLGVVWCIRVHRLHAAQGGIFLTRSGQCTSFLQHALYLSFAHQVGLQPDHTRVAQVKLMRAFQRRCSGIETALHALLRRLRDQPGDRLVARAHQPGTQRGAFGVFGHALLQLG
jgi:hypothetical protein